MKNSRQHIVSKVGVSGLFFVLTFLLSCNSQPSIKSLNWLTGTWQQIDGDYIEQWQFKNQHLKGKSYKLEQDSVIVLEQLQIVLENNIMEYRATVVNQNNGLTIPFKLLHQTKNKWVFENNKHDFPQRITYFKQAGKFMRVIIDGTINNHYKKQEWHLKKMPK